ncbi:MAG: hypothetical protein R3B49_01600 [Phycisphaerales bacterium]
MKDATGKRRWWGPMVLKILAALGVVVAALLVYPAYLVYEISHAVPGDNPGSVEQVYELIDRYQEAGADPADGNAYDMLAAVVERVGELREEASERMRAEVGGDAALSDRMNKNQFDVEPSAAYKDAFEFDPNDWEYPQADAINALHRRYAREFLEAVESGEVPAMLDEMARTRYARRTQAPGWIVFTLLPELSGARFVARVSYAAMRLEAEAGREDEVVRLFERDLAIARVIGHQPTLIERLVAVAVDVFGFETACDLAIEGRLSPETMRAMLAAMDRQLPLPPGDLAFEASR